MTDVIIGAFPSPQAAAAAETELREAGAAEEDFAVIDQETVGKVADDVIDVLGTLGVPDDTVTSYALVIDAGGVALSVKDNTLSSEEVTPCFQHHDATVINVVTPPTGSRGQQPK